MTPFGMSVARELQRALVPIETASIVDHRYLGAASRALLDNALFYVLPAPAIERAREAAVNAADQLAASIAEAGVRPRGVSLAVDLARADAIVAHLALIDAVANAEPTVAGRALGVA